MNIVRDKYANCLETVFLNLINYYKLPNSKLIYSYSWDFGYVAPNGLSLDERLSNVKSIHLQQELLEKYFGIKITWVEEKHEVKKHLYFDYPVIICMDSFWCPWTMAFKIDHVPHYFIAQGKKGNVFLCCDYYFNQSNQILDYDFFEKGCTKIGFISRCHASEYNYINVFKDSIQYVTNGNNDLGDYVQICELANEIRSDKYLFEKIGGSSNKIENSKVLLAINHIGNGRFKYVSHWSQYSDIEPTGIIKYVTEELVDVAALWKRILTNMIRICLENYNRKRVLQLYDDLMEISCQEEKIANIAYEKIFNKK